MIAVHEFQAGVEAAFLQTGRGSAPWPNPYPEPDLSSVPDEAYSRLTNPAKWRILSSRTDAWLDALGDVDDAGVVLGVGNPAECVNWFPDCGCDACDSGSQNELDHLDVHLLGIVTGSFRRLTRGKRVITVIGDGGWSASGFRSAARRIGHQVEAVLAEPHGWNELRGRSWLDTT